MKNREKKPRKEEQKKGDKEQKECLKEINDKQPFLDQLFEKSAPEQIEQAVIQLKEFEDKLNPIFPAYLAYFEKIENKEQFVKNIPDIVQNFTKHDIQNKVFRVVLVHIEKANIQGFDKNEMCHLIEKVPDPVLFTYIKIFEIEGKINREELIKRLQTVLGTIKEKKNFQDAVHLLKLLEYDVDYSNLVINVMMECYEASKAADIVIAAKFDPKKYENINDRLKQNTVYYLEKEFEWYKVEDLLMDKRDMMGMYASVLLKKDQYEIAASLIKRHNLMATKKIFGKQKEKYLQLFENAPDFELTPNPIYQKDEFLPTEVLIDNSKKNEYLTLEQFGIKEQDVIFLDQENQQLDQAIQDILNSPITGIDSEFRGGQDTKLEHRDQNNIALLQIATPTKGYLFDAVALENSAKMAKFFDEYLQNDNMIIGHTVQEDLNRTKCNFKSQEKVEFNQVKDVCEMYKQLKKESKSTSLAKIAMNYFGKTMSKFDQCSIWVRRPLRKSQMHYATMDAVICIQLYDKIIHDEPVPEKQEKPQQEKNVQIQEEPEIKLEQNQQQQQLQQE